MKANPTVLFLLVSVLGSGVIFAQTPDGETPSEEQACDKYEGEGARYGLCVAYCEAQDCDDHHKGDPSCTHIAQEFIDWSVKHDYIKKPKPGTTIDCRVTACSADDIRFCGGREIDCEIDRECTRVCTSEFQGFDELGRPLCTRFDPRSCRKCVADKPTIELP